MKYAVASLVVCMLLKETMHPRIASRLQKSFKLKAMGTTNTTCSWDYVCEVK